MYILHMKLKTSDSCFLLLTTIKQLQIVFVSCITFLKTTGSNDLHVFDLILCHLYLFGS